MEKILWTPRLYGSYDFNIYLDGDFARNIIQSNVVNGGHRNMNNLANGELKMLNINCLDPYQFYNNSCFVSQIYLRDGLWLSTNYQTIDNLLNKTEAFEFVEYCSHNVDSSEQVYILIKLFDKWIQYSDLLKKS